MNLTFSLLVLTAGQPEQLDRPHKLLLFGQWNWQLLSFLLTLTCLSVDALCLSARSRLILLVNWLIGTSVQQIWQTIISPERAVQFCLASECFHLQVVRAQLKGILVIFFLRALINAMRYPHTMSLVRASVLYRDLQLPASAAAASIVRLSQSTSLTSLRSNSTTKPQQPSSSPSQSPSPSTKMTETLEVPSSDIEIVALPTHLKPSSALDTSAESGMLSNSSSIAHTDPSPLSSSSCSRPSSAESMISVISL